MELSRLLNRLQHPEGAGADYRNGNGVRMKLSNFLRLDDEYEGVGLRAGGHLEEELWREYASDRARLRRTAAAITAHVGEAPEHGAGAPELDDELEVTEGGVLMRSHRRSERSQALRRRKIKAALTADPRIPCEVCTRSFEVTYGEIGRGFIEVHHRVPLARLEPGVRTRLADLVTVCPNCHRMLHRGGFEMTPEVLRGVVGERRLEGQGP